MKCPFCAEQILDTAQVCKHCGRDFLLVRPLLDQIQAISKRVAAVEDQYAELIDAQYHPKRLVGQPADPLPSIPRASAVIFAVVFVITAGLFIAAIVARLQLDSLLSSIAGPGVPGMDAHSIGVRSTLYAGTALMLFPFIFGFLCENLKARPFLTDVVTAVLVAVLSILVIQLIRWELLDGIFLPRGWAVSPEGPGRLPPNSWATLLLNAATLFFSFKAGAFFRYWMYLRRTQHRIPITFATPVSRQIVTRWGGHLESGEVESQIKRVDAIIHSLSGIGSAGIAIAAYLTSHLAAHS